MMKKLYGAAAMAMLLTGCGGAEEPAEQAINVITSPSYTAASVTETVTETETAATTIPEPVTASVSFTALGDNLIHSSLYKQAARRAEEEGCDKPYDFTRAYEGAADLFDRSDITVLNQETLICGEGYEPSTYPTFNSPVELGDCMAELGVDVFTMANNHMLDKGEQGLRSCLSYYDERGYMRVGAYYDEADRSDIRVLEKNGVKVAFLSYTESLNGLHLPEGSELQLGLLGEKERVLEEVAQADSISDICVVSLHWGTENSSVTEDYQRDMAAKLSEAGADVIIGNHPHVLREIEILENPDGSQTLCAYSLGNLISAQSVGTNLIGGVLDFEVTIQLEGEPCPRITSFDFTPVVTHYDRGYSDVRLYKLSDYTPELAAAHGVRAYSNFSYEYILEYLEKQGLSDMK